MTAEQAKIIGVLLRDYRGEMSQARLSELSGVGEKTISSFETGERVHAMKLVQLLAMLGASGVPLVRFCRDLGDVLPDAESYVASNALN